MAKLYNNKEWLFYYYHVKKMTVDEIALLASCTSQTIYVKLREFGLL